MSSQPLFAGLVADELGNPVETAFIGSEPCYVVNDDGFRRHIPAGHVRTLHSARPAWPRGTRVATGWSPVERP